MTLPLPKWLGWLGWLGTNAIAIFNAIHSHDWGTLAAIVIGSTVAHHATAPTAGQ